MEFDEKEAIDYIRAHALAHAGVDYDDDQLLNVLDMIFDYYESNGMLDPDADDDDDDEEQLVSDLTEYATRMLRRDRGAVIDPAHVEAIIKAELDYENSLL